MTRSAPSPRSKPKSRLGWLPAVLGGAVVGGLVTAVVLHSPGGRGGEYDALLEADDTRPEMVRVDGGTFVMGNDDGAPDERPSHEVSVEGFWMDRTEVTNGQFAAFVKATGYVTVAERAPDPKKYPDADPKLLVPGSAVYVPVPASLDPRDWDGPSPPWWKYVPGACWRRPEGLGSSIKGKKNDPVVHIAWEDADAYARWAGKRLPTE